MKRARFSEEQIIGLLKAAEVGEYIRAACREHNIMDQTFYRWRNKYGGMDVSEAKKLIELERENTELKKMVAELSLDNQILKELNSKNGEPAGPTSWNGALGEDIHSQRT
jgi:putative transposase